METLGKLFLNGQIKWKSIIFDDLTKTPKPLFEYIKLSFLSSLATADENYLISLWDNLNMKIEYNWLREPEIGSIMVQGKAGATGDNFNVGEVTITRCSLNLDKKIQGHGYVQGRNKYKSKIAALCDALMQTEKKEIIKRNIIDK